MTPSTKRARLALRAARAAGVEISLQRNETNTHTCYVATYDPDSIQTKQHQQAIKRLEQLDAGSVIACLIADEPIQLPESHSAKIH